MHCMFCSVNILYKKPSHLSLQSAFICYHAFILFAQWMLMYPDYGQCLRVTPCSRTGCEKQVLPVCRVCTEPTQRLVMGLGFSCNPAICCLRQTHTLKTDLLLQECRQFLCFLSVLLFKKLYISMWKSSSCIAMFYARIDVPVLYTQWICLHMYGLIYYSIQHWKVPLYITQSWP